MDPLIKSPCGPQCFQSLSYKPESIRRIECIEELNVLQTKSHPNHRPTFVVPALDQMRSSRRYKADTESREFVFVTFSVERFGRAPSTSETV